MKEELGLVHIYCGNGKGKTTASLGIVLRAVACNLNVVFCQFMKDNDSSELKVLNKLNNVTVISGKGVRGFTKYMKRKDLRQVEYMHMKHFKDVEELCRQGKCDVVVLDEIIGAINKKLINFDSVINFLKNRPSNIEVIMTGRDPRDELIEIADYVSEIEKVKHPFDKGINARYGVEK